LALGAILSHLACADEPTHPVNAAQLAAFRAALPVLSAGSGKPPAPASLAASSGIFLGPDYHFDIARPGAALYGVNPTPSVANPMAQVVRLRGKILQLRDVDRGVSVGYGATHRMERPGRIATVAVGYADGWFRSSSHRGSAGVAGQRVPVVGRISMDLLTLDVTDIDPDLAQPGAFVDLIDERQDVDAVAAAAGTIGYEVLTALGRRYHRVYRGR
jgi:alanine racemase